MKIKVCGMRNSENISELIKLKPDYMGFIFYKKSKRFVSDFPQVKIPSEIKKVGVFVNETIETIVKIVQKHQLDAVQLHGNETPEYIRSLSGVEVTYNENINNVISTPLNRQVEIFKAFSVDDDFDFSKTEPYQKVCDYLLFDTKGKDYGGNGVKFNWQMLDNYKGELPYMLSGGITKDDSQVILSFLRRQESNKCIGVDINSGFEIEPALKNIANIKEFKQNL
ncbi:phosphoribosylanthranilate isomerase [Lutibacter oricola]|uniref:N-(5'-phosphoribosyl)anthranilate isomerase n=1 Tax=Lutibacter oricola TaxID=762486 RepID=A0A1H2YUP2_9FLAO|nr:phosphoribosylanthranilate isomerase [Lutibacter oricola]SDX08767.1 phosphoribosylanthranilate isomerase [Lutibacter oricola]